MLNLLGRDPSGYSICVPKVTSCSTLGLVLKQNTFKISHMFNLLSTTVIQHKTHIHKIKQRKTSRKESVNSDGQKFHQYQQNEKKNASS